MPFDKSTVAPKLSGAYISCIRWAWSTQGTTQVCTITKWNTTNVHTLPAHTKGGMVAIKAEPRVLRDWAA